MSHEGTIISYFSDIIQDMKINEIYIYVISLCVHNGKAIL